MLGDHAFDYERLAVAIATRDSSYRLLMWITHAVDRGLIQPSRVAHNANESEAAKEWLWSNYFHIPDDLRPNEAAMDEFAAFFSTYLTSSFDVIEKPATKGVRPIPPGGCRCDVCMRIVRAPHLQAKKLRTADKQYAELLMTECMKQLARDNALYADEQLVANLVVDPGTRRSAAYVTYGHWLILRLSGASPGAAILALWRLIAWDPRGGMRPGFKLELDDFKAAEKKLLTAIRENRQH